MSCPAQGATGGWVMPGLAFKWVPLYEFSLFDTPQVRTLVVEGLGISAPTLKAQGLISGREKRLHKWFVLALNEIKTNTQKGEKGWQRMRPLDCITDPMDMNLTKLWEILKDR